MDDLKTSESSMEITQTVHDAVKKYATSVGMVINKKNNTIQQNVKTTASRVPPGHSKTGRDHVQEPGFEMKR